MGVKHSMEEDQVKRISKALNGSARAIQGINSKFDLIDEHVQKMMEFNRTSNTKVNQVLSSFERLDDTFNDRAELLLESLVGATNTLTEVLECAVVSLDKVNIRQELDSIPKAMITLAIPFVILVIELAVLNAYHGIILASLPSVNLKYSNYLIAYASFTLMGLFLSLLWLICYRVWLSTPCQRYSTVKTEQTLQRLSRLRTRSSDFSEGVLSDSLESQVPSELGISDPSNSNDLTRSQTRVGDKSSGSLSWAKARRIERKRQRSVSGEDEDFENSSDAPMSPGQPVAPSASRASMALSELGLPPLLEKATEGPDSPDERKEPWDCPDQGFMSSPSEQSSADLTEERLEHAARIAAEAAAEAECLSDPVMDDRPKDTPQDDSSRTATPGEGGEGAKKSMVQMRWNSWDHPFQMDMTWRGRKAAAASSGAPALPATEAGPVSAPGEGDDTEGETKVVTLSEAQLRL